MIDPLHRHIPKQFDFERGDTAILCEGRDEAAVLNKLCGDWKRKPKIGVVPEGKSFEEEIKNLSKAAIKDQIATIGFVRDAEDDYASCEKQLKRWLKGAGLTPPEHAGTGALSSVNGAHVTIAYLVNPAVNESGAIETLFLPQIRTSPRWPCLEALLTCYAEREQSDQSRDKVIVRTFIAHSNGYNTGLNAALKPRQSRNRTLPPILSCDSTEFDSIRAFLDLLRSSSPIEHAGKGT